MKNADPAVARTKSGSSWGLLRRRESLCVTLRGWLLLCLLLLGFFLTGAKTVHPFLAVTKPLAGEALVVEGWSPDYALQEAVAEFKRRSYKKLYVTGGPLEAGAPLSEYKTFAELGAATLLRLGFPPEQLQAVPAPEVRQDRTYTSAIALKKFLGQHGSMPARLNVMTEGPHARRSWVLFEKAFGKEAVIGIISTPSREYDPAHWWTSSAGVRTTLDEIIAYSYARLFFHPQPENER